MLIILVRADVSFTGTSGVRSRDATVRSMQMHAIAFKHY